MRGGVKHFFWIPFGELLHGELSVADAVFSAGPGNPEWWKGRAKVLERYTLPSLLNQTVKADIWAGVARETESICKPVHEAIYNAGGCVVYHPARDATKYGKAPAREAIIAALEGYELDAVVFTCIDSDDMYLSTAQASVEMHRAQPGLALLFRAGYIYNAETGQMAFYDPKGSPPPFHARTYTREYLSDPDAYEARWNYNLCHPQFGRLKNHHDLPDKQYVVVTHGQNTSTEWGKKTLRLGGKLTGFTTKERARAILKSCGGAA